MTDRQDTAVRAPLGERISAKLSNAADEHRANARPESGKAAAKAAAGGRPPRPAPRRRTPGAPWAV